MNAYPTPKILVEALKNGDEKAFNQVYKAYYTSFHDIASIIVKDKQLAQDMVSEGMARAWQHIDRYNPAMGTLWTWMLNIVRNLAIDYIRGKAHKNGLVTDSIDGYDVYGEYDLHEDRHTLERAMQELPKKHKDVLTKLYFEGATHEECASDLHIPLGTVKTRNKNAIREMRKQLV
jgi:RNA polymerase sigma factor (sigma-70 family)